MPVKTKSGREVTRNMPVLKKKRGRPRKKEDFLMDKPPEMLDEIKWDVFNGFCQGKSGQELAEMAGVTEKTISKWKHSDWWRALYEQFVTQKQREIYLTMSAQADQMLEGFMKVMKGDDKNDKTAMARVNGFKIYLESGKEPILQKNPQLTINNNTQVNNLSLDKEKLKSLNKSELLEIARTGNVPEGLKN